jgi:hypothetical protein
MHPFSVSKCVPAGQLVFTGGAVAVDGPQLVERVAAMSSADANTFQGSHIL